MSDTTSAYIYLLQDGHDKGTNIFKIGRTVQEGGDTRKIKRIQSYSRGTIVYNTFHVHYKQVNNIERQIKISFNLKYRLVKGSEWFEGNVHDMKSDIDIIINTYVTDAIKDPIIKTVSKTNECKKTFEGTLFSCVQDVLRSEIVSSGDKQKIIQCLHRVQMFHSRLGHEPDWGNCDITVNRGQDIYKVHKDEFLEYVQTIKPHTHVKLGYRTY